MPDLKLRLDVEVDMMSLLLSARGEEVEGTIMDWDITVLEEGELVIIMSPVMDWLMLGGRSPTPAMLELSPKTQAKYFRQVNKGIFLPKSMMKHFCQIDYETFSKRQCFLQHGEMLQRSQ